MKTLITLTMICFAITTQAQELKKMEVSELQMIITHDTVITWEDHNLEKHSKQHMKREDNMKQAVYHLVTVLPFAFLAGFYNGKD
jgi:hypothetical protein